MEGENSAEKLKEDTETQEAKLDEAEKVRENTVDEDKKPDGKSAVAISLSIINVGVLVGTQGKKKADAGTDENVKQLKVEKCVYRLGYTRSYLNWPARRPPCCSARILYSSSDDLWRACATGSRIRSHHGNDCIFHVKLTVDNDYPLL